MAMDIKLIALDLDGTLLAPDHRTVSPRTCSALRRAAEGGVHVVLASGRSQLTMEETARTLGCVRYMVCASGAVVLDRTAGERLLDRSFSPEEAAPLLRCIDRLDIPAEVYSEGNIYISRRHWELPEDRPAEFTRLRETFVEPVGSLPEHLAGHPVEKADLDGMSPEQRERLLALAGSLGGMNVSLSTDGAEFCRADADKGTALAFLCARLGIAPGEVMAFGDGENDRGMLSWAGWSFAMGNARETVRGYARYGTAANCDDGVALAVERYAISL